jgi:hypothetical protein
MERRKKRDVVEARAKLARRKKKSKKNKAPRDVLPLLQSASDLELLLAAPLVATGRVTSFLLLRRPRK